jgi:hypothetical protein
MAEGRGSFEKEVDDICGRLTDEAPATLAKRRGVGE